MYRQGKLHAALTYLQKALKIEGALENVENPADTHLNMCAGDDACFLSICLYTEYTLLIFLEIFINSIIPAGEAC
jgi:hypothetical protein